MLSIINLAKTLAFLFLIQILQKVRGTPSFVPVRNNGNKDNDEPLTRNIFKQRNLTWKPPPCLPNEILSNGRCLKTSNLLEECIEDSQCIKQDSSCIENRCQCSKNHLGVQRCHRFENTALEIYTITMILASSCLALIVLIFLACFCQRSICARTRSSPSQPPRLHSNSNSYSLYPNAGPSSPQSSLYTIRELIEKPPSYDETVKQQQAFKEAIGTLPPPPEYNSVIESISTPSQTQPSINLNRSTSCPAYQGRSRAGCYGHLNQAFTPES